MASIGFGMLFRNQVESTNRPLPPERGPIFRNSNQCSHPCIKQLWWLTLAAPLTVIATNAAPTGIMTVVGGLLPYFIIAILLRRLILEISHRQRQRERCEAVVAEMNHHVRNALQVMSYVSYIHKHPEIRDAVDKIDAALREVLPLVHE